MMARAASVCADALILRDGLVARRDEGLTFQKYEFRFEPGIIRSYDARAENTGYPKLRLSEVRRVS